MLSLTGEEKQKHFNFILLILKVHNKDNLKQFHMRLSPLLMYHIPFLLGSHEECSGNDLIRWYPCVQFLSYLTSGKKPLRIRERGNIKKSRPSMSASKLILKSHLMEAKPSLEPSCVLELFILFSLTQGSFAVSQPIGKFFYFFGLQARCDAQDMIVALFTCDFFC